MGAVHSAAGSADHVQCLRRSGSVEVRADDDSALGGEEQGRRPTLAPGSAGEEDDLSTEPAAHGQQPLTASVTKVVSDLLTATAIAEDPADFIRRHARVLTQFDHHTQDSGNVSWLVEAGAERLFVKTAGRDAPAVAGAPAPYLDHPGRVALLRNAIDLAGTCHHPALAPLLNVIESPPGPMLVYEAASGERVGVARAERNDPGSAYRRFAALPVEDLVEVFDVLIDLHVTLAATGWVAGDLYDGCLIVDFATNALTVVDLDSYRRGPSINDMGRMFGSTRFMAPEEFVRGAVIDERTTVFTIGRLVWHFATRLSERPEDFCGPLALRDVVQHACQRRPDARPVSVAAFGDGWRRARTGRSDG